jgi:fido (protein-threonine AMPylation protein)
MTGLLDEEKGATPLTPEEREGLIPSHVTLHSELNELEQQNILEADVWASLRKLDPVNEPFGRNLDRRMFCDVWQRAGAYRTSDKNIGGVPWQLIQPRLYEVLEQTRYAVRFHHAPVYVHPFANGNGSGIMAQTPLAYPTHRIAWCVVRAPGLAERRNDPSRHSAAIPAILNFCQRLRLGTRKYCPMPIDRLAGLTVIERRRCNLNSIAEHPASPNFKCDS